MRMPRRTFSLAALCLAAAACAQVGDKAGEPQVPIVPANLIPPSPPLTAEEALRSFKVAPGYRIELTPFGGIKDSGLGYKEGVQEAIKSFTTIKTYSLPWV